MRVADRQ